MQIEIERNQLSPRIQKLKDRLLSAPYEICMARAHYFTTSYKETKGMDPCLRNALALKKTLENQKINIYNFEKIVGNATEKFLSGPLSVDRGDFLRTLQMEIEILPKKIQPFVISRTDKKLFWKEILPYWDGRTVRDYKARDWEKQGLIKTKLGPTEQLRSLSQTIGSVKYTGFEGFQKMAGASLRALPTVKKTMNLIKLRYELAKNNPTPAIFCFDVQGHLSLGVDKAVNKGFTTIIREAEDRLKKLEKEEPNNESGKNFLKSVVISLEAAIKFAERHAELAEQLMTKTNDEQEKKRLKKIAEACRNVPKNKPRNFYEAIQAAWFALVVGQIQYGTHEVFAVGRCDQYLYPYYKLDIEQGRLSKAEAIENIQEFYLKLTASVEPIPELGMETNGVLGNSQRCVAIGGLTTEGKDATNELSMLMLEAHDIMKGAINQLSVRLHKNSPKAFVNRTSEVFRRTNGIAIYNDEAIVKALTSDGLSLEDACDYCIVGCIETSGQSNTHGCPGGHEIILPAILVMVLTRGKLPVPSPGQIANLDAGDLSKCDTFEKFLTLFRNQLKHQIRVLIKATAGKDRAYRDHLPAPYVSALMNDCIEKVKDITNGGAKYDFTSIDVRGLATLVDSLLAIKTFVYDKREFSLIAFLKIVSKNFKKNESLRQRIIHKSPKYGTSNQEADNMALAIIDWVYEEAQKYRNIRGGAFRPCFYSYGNHVIDGIMLGSATPDGRLRGSPISNGVSPTDLIDLGMDPSGPMKTVAKFPPAKISSGVSLNMRFHPNFIATEQGLNNFSALVCSYFEQGGMHLQPNVVSTETLRKAQAHPENYRDLVVKVSGYSAYFTDLGKSIQEDIISRSEFK